MYKRIVVPLDGSPLAEQLLPYVRIIAGKLGARIDLVRAVEPVPTETAGELGAARPRGFTIKDLVARLHTEAEEYLSGVAQRLRAEGLQVSTLVREEDPTDLIVDQAGKEPDTLVAISTHGRSGVTRWVMGSVADKVLHTIEMPLLVIRPKEGPDKGPAITLKNLIVPLDGSKLAEQALPHAIALAKALSLNVTLARALPPSAFYYGYNEYVAASYPDIVKEMESAAQQYLERTAQQVKQQGVGQVTEMLFHGNPAAAIVDAAHDVRGSIIVMTTHGRSGIGRWVLGSVADRVVTHSGDPVLLIRAKS